MALQAPCINDHARPWTAMLPFRLTQHGFAGARRAQEAPLVLQAPCINRRDSDQCSMALQARVVLKSRQWYSKHQATDHWPPCAAKSACALYSQRMVALHAIDFDEMVELTVKIFKTSPKALAIARKAHQHLLVDEFQVRVLSACRCIPVCGWLILADRICVRQHEQHIWL